MKIETLEKEVVMEAVNAAIEHSGKKKEEVIPILNHINRQLGYLPKEALAAVSDQLQLAQSQVFATASFYHMLRTEPVGKHIILFCESAPCHVAGGQQVWDRLQKELNLKEGETSPDGKWTLMTTSCLGACGVGPAIVIDDDIHGNVSPDQIPDILANYS
jgi:NADH-quinone oxidoreductase subunit E